MRKILTLFLAISFIAITVNIPVAGVLGGKSDNSDSPTKEATPVVTAEEYGTLPQYLLENDSNISVWNSKEEYEASQIAAQNLSEVVTTEFQPLWFTFKVVNANSQEPLAGAIIIIDGTPRFADSLGEIYIKVSKPTIELKVDKNGYSPFVEYFDIQSASEKGDKQKTIYLKNPSDDVSIFNVAMDFEGDTVNLLNQSYSADVTAIDSDQLSLKVEATVGENFYLYKGETLVATSTSGQFNGLSFTELKGDDSDLFVQSEYEGLKSKKSKLLLDRAQFDEVNAENLFNLQTGLEMPDFGDDIIGKIDFEYLQLIRRLLKIHGNKNIFQLNDLDLGISIFHDNINHCYKIVYGFNLGLGQRKDNKNREAMYDTFKKSYKWRRNNPNPYAKSQSIGKSLSGAFKKVESKYTRIGLKKASLNIEIDFVGYLELNDGFSKNASNESDKKFIRDGGFSIFGNASVDITTQFVVVAIPVFVTFTPGVGLGLDYDSADIERMLTLIVQLRMKVAGGVGIQDFCSISVYGDLNFYGNICLTNIYNTYFNGTAKFGLDARFLLFSLNIPIGPEFEMYNTMKSRSLTSLMASGPQLDINTNVFLDAKPQITVIGDKKIAVWIDYDNTRDAFNNTKLYFSVCENDVWSAPQSVYDDGRADFYPAIYSSGKDVFVAWHKSAATYTAEDTVDVIAASSEVLVSKFDKSLNSFIAPVKLSQEGKMSTLPKFGKTVDNIPIISWQGNSLNDWFGLSGQNIIYESRYLNGAWTPAVKVLESELPIVSYDCLYSNGNSEYAVVLDTDKDLNTITDREIFSVQNAVATKLTQNDYLDSNPKFGKVNGQFKLFYYRNNEIVYADFDSIENYLVAVSSYVSITDNYEIISDNTSTAVVYTKISDNELQKQISLFENGKFRESIAYLKDVKNIEQISSVIYNGNLESVMLTIDRNDDNSVKSSTLAFKTYEFSTDIALNEAYSLEALKSGKNDIYLEIENVGSTEISSIGLNAGSLSETLILEQTLFPGEKQIIKATVNSEYFVDSKITFAISIPNSTDNDLSNNTFALNMDYANYEMSVIQKMTGEKESFEVSVKNASISEQDCKLVIKINDKDGAIIYTSDLMVLQANSIVKLNISFDYQALGLKKGDKLYFELKSESEQLSSVYTSVFIAEDVKQYSIGAITEWTDLLQTAKRIIGGIL